jgi:diguanylate cyclase (GGDEF)-like protein
LVLAEGAVLIKRCAVGPRGLVIGRGADCGLVLSGPEVSRRHVRIRRDKGRCLAEDLGSTNGTFVNGRRVDKHTLVHGDEVAVGGFTVVFDDGRGVAGLGEETMAGPAGGETGRIRARYAALSERMRGSAAAGELSQLHGEMERSRKRHKAQALTDPLTGLANRGCFDREVKAYLERARRGGKPLSLLFIDLDHFKRVNDTHGHDKGDEALKCAARLVRSACRRGDLVARYGGEEIVALFPGMPAASAKDAAETIRSIIAEKSPAALGFGITASIGASTFPDHADDAPALVKKADQAVYRAKKNGRNRVEASGE